MHFLLMTMTTRKTSCTECIVSYYS